VRWRKTFDIFRPYIEWPKQRLPSGEQSKVKRSGSFEAQKALML
jgi:hypothetical protein